VRSINKTPVVLQRRLAGFLVNAGLAAYMLEAEKIYREGTPVEAIDAAMRETIFPMGPFELGDQAGLDIAAGMFDTIARRRVAPFAPLVWKLREAKRFGVKSGAGVYDYADGKKQGVWPGLAAARPRARAPRRRGGRDRRPLREARSTRRPRALRSQDRRLEEECDLAFVFGIGFAMYLGGRSSTRSSAAGPRAPRAARGRPCSCW
jgi:3-hydroxyacyl-CoA dehydrogenase/enoyl-CoA hydratase/3-hydroxybutyryl-CoA epimerase